MSGNGSFKLDASLKSIIKKRPVIAKEIPIPTKEKELSKQSSEKFEEEEK